MNYFGHLALASEFSGVAEFLLGSMLPDLAGIIGCSTPQCELEPLQRGVDFHLATDDEFHRAAVFRNHVTEICQRLESSQMRKGPARAVAHVAFELLLDAELGKVPTYGVAFRTALHSAGPNRVGRRLRWTRPSAAERFESLRLRLIERNTCSDFFAKDRLVERLVYALRPRPRLCLTPAERGILQEWIHGSSVPNHDDLASLWLLIRERVAQRWQTHPLTSVRTALVSHRSHLPHVPRLMG